MNETTLEKIAYREYMRFVNREISRAAERQIYPEEKPGDTDLIALVLKVSRWNLSCEAKLCFRDAFYDYVKSCGENNFPEYLRARERSELRYDLTNDSWFCEMAGIPYVSADSHNVDIDLALAYFYLKQIGL